MYDSIPEIADDLNRLRSAIQELSARIDHRAIGLDDVRSKLGDWAEVMLSLHDRLIVFNRPSVELPVAGIAREEIGAHSHEAPAAGGA